MLFLLFVLWYSGNDSLSTWRFTVSRCSPVILAILLMLKPFRCMTLISINTSLVIIGNTSSWESATTVFTTRVVHFYLALFGTLLFCHLKKRTRSLP